MTLTNALAEKADVALATPASGDSSAVAERVRLAGVISSDRWIRWTTTAAVVVLAGIAAVVSFRHMRELALAHGEDELAAALIPLAVDGTIVAASMALLRASRQGERGGVLPWMLLVVSSVASIGANVAVAEPTVIARVIAGWPSLALIGAYEMLMCQIRPSATTARRPGCRSGGDSAQTPSVGEGERMLQRAAWQWARDTAGESGSLPTGVMIARQFERSPRWGRLVKRAGNAGELG
ncbi:DUF2637 domain-containing protein [Nonomuraea sp. FMUSA5-5]|uniref:DUF2637 domain-containing protein n=1 Tax=Nonomuraea composti TaxID=2720023 RepID=A0ABX1AWT0_9ACTN|nr:DUF2637 domain-containing protein [Nonomuraea sp. FMUSA5-5]NJP89396.1 DUF2637 domain-containing protein [Nonomuraea sp. FMUSA5-5]